MSNRKEKTGRKNKATMPPEATPDISDGESRLLRHGLPNHAPGVPDRTEVVAFQNGPDTGETHEMAVGYGSTQGAVAKKVRESEATDDWVIEENAADIEEGIEEGSNAQGKYRADEITAGGMELVQPEIVKTVEPKNLVKLLKKKAKKFLGKAKKLTKRRLIPLEKARDELERSRDALPWLSKLTTHLYVALVVAAVTTIGFDAVVISISASFLPFEDWARWVFAGFVGLGVIVAVTALSFLWATALGAEENDRLWRRPPARLFAAACLLTLIVGGLLGIGFWQLAEYRAEAIQRLAHGLALDPKFVLPMQCALSVSAVIIETVVLVSIKGKVLAKEVAKKETMISATRALIDALEGQAYELLGNAAELMDDAAGLAQARINGILLAVEANAIAALSKGESAASAAYSTFWNSFDAAKYGLWTFQSEGDIEEGFLSRLRAYRRGLLLTIAGLSVTLFAGVMGFALAGPLAGLSAGLAAGSFTAFRGGMDPDARSSLRRMARKSEPRALAVIAGFSLAALSGTWVLLGPLPAMAAAAVTAAVLAYRVYGGTQPPDSIDSAVEHKQFAEVVKSDPLVTVVDDDTGKQAPDGPSEGIVPGTVVVPIPADGDGPEPGSNGDRPSHSNPGVV